jgi:hypothetical protein
MIAYLLDENISFTVAEQLALKNPMISAQSVYHWQDGILVGQEDGSILHAAAHENLTLVTYDLRTMPGLLSELFADGEAHSGVIFVDDASIRSNNIGGLVMALIAHWQIYAEEEWTNRVAFLEPV